MIDFVKLPSPVVSSKFVFIYLASNSIRLVFDVIKMHNQSIKRALIFACGNSLVCDTSNDARIVSSGEMYKHKVSHYCHKAGQF